MKSKCCDTEIVENTDLCSKCFEHTGEVSGKVGYSKEEQLGSKKNKKSPQFGKKPSPWRKDGKKAPKKVKKNDILDADFLEFVGRQPCAVTGIVAERGIGADNIHVHHIDGRNRGTNDYETVPLIGTAHTWGLTSAYHSIAPSDFKKKYIPHYKGTVKQFFKEHAIELKMKYCEEGGIIVE